MMLRLLVSVALCGWMTSSAFAATFTYNPPGKLVSGSGKGTTTSKDYTPNMRFPIEKAPAYPNSQVWGAGGSKGPGGGQCAKANYSYPWWDNYCETRSWTMPLCPSGTGHQGQDIRPASCEFNKHWVVASEDGTITSIGTYIVYMKGKSGTTHRYGHMKMTALPIKKGQAVKMGQKLGLVDNDFGGTGTTLHLHYDRKQYISGVGTVYVPTYMYLVNSYKKLIGDTGPKCDAAACAAKSGCSGWSACGGFASTCDTTGAQSRSCTTYACAGATCGSSKKTETKACSKPTDGVVVANWTAWSACTTSGGCSESGTKSRTRKVCKGGKTVTESASGACSVSSEGKVVKAWSAWGTCGGFEWPCDESGVHSRKQSVCKSGKAVESSQTKECAVDKDGQQVQPWGPFGACVGVKGPCDEDGAQARTRLVCEDQATTPQQQTKACQRQTDGDVVKPWSDWGVCEPITDPCDGRGKRRREQTVCGDGAERVEAEEQLCDVDCATVGASSGGGASGGGSSSGNATGGDAVTGGDINGNATASPLVARSTGSACNAAKTPNSRGVWLVFAAFLLLFVSRQRMRLVESTEPRN